MVTERDSRDRRGSNQQLEGFGGANSKPQSLEMSRNLLKAKSEIMQNVRKCDWLKNKLFKIARSVGVWETGEKSKN